MPSASGWWNERDRSGASGTPLAGGTEFEAEFSPKLKWLKTSGIIQKDKWGNLPGGEILTSPLTTNGIFVVDGVIGDYLCARYGDLREAPLTIEVENSRIRS